MAVHQRFPGALPSPGLGSIIVHGGPRYGIDFKGGAQMTVKWNGAPPVDKIRAALSSKLNGEVSVQPLTDIAAKDELVIGTERMGEQQMNAARKTMQDTLEATFGEPQSGKLDFNNAGAGEIGRPSARCRCSRRACSSPSSSCRSLAARSAHISRHAAALRADLELRSTIGCAGRKLCYY